MILHPPSSVRHALGASFALGALALALVALPAPCAAAAGASCPLMGAMATSGGGSHCSMPRQAMSCCGEETAPPAAAVPVAAPPESAPAGVIPAGPPAAAPFIAASLPTLDAAPPAVGRAPLYTLHASLLI